MAGLSELTGPRLTLTFFVCVFEGGGVLFLKCSRNVRQELLEQVLGQTQIQDPKTIKNVTNELTQGET